MSNQREVVISATPVPVIEKALKRAGGLNVEQDQFAAASLRPMQLY